MATYNGARFVRQQIDSILPQLSNGDELIVVDDASTDNTVEIVREYRDDRIRLTQNSQNVGVVKTFERALELALGDLIFLADQDDLWDPEKVSIFRREFLTHPEAAIIVSDARVIDADGRTLGTWNDRLPFSPGLATNLLKNRYVGCLMAFRRDLLSSCLPFPPRVPMHDSWLGLMGRFRGKTLFIPKCLVSYRRHPSTVTTGKHAGFLRMLRWRLTLFRHLILRTTSGLIRSRHDEK